RIAGENCVAERQLCGLIWKIDGLPRGLYRDLRKRAVHRKNSRHRQNHYEETNATIHFPLHSVDLPRECNTQVRVRQAAEAVPAPEDRHLRGISELIRI